MKTTKIKLTRTLTVAEFPWLQNDLLEGTELFVFTGPTYGCISKNGIAVSLEYNQTPYFEVPKEFVVYLLID